ncbi:MAG: AI-2E family transporter [Microthrixaceae bacterium]
MATTTLRITPRSIVRAIVLVGVFGLVAAVAIRATGTLAWFVQAAVFAALGWPLVQRLGRHMPRFVAVLLITAVIAGLAGMLGATGLVEMQAESTRFRDRVPAAVRDLERTAGIGTIVRDLRLADDIEQFGTEIADRLRFKDADVPGLASKVGGSASAVFVVWILTVMLVFTGPGMVEAALRLAPETARDPVRDVLRAGYGRSVRYLGCMALRAIAVGLIAFTVSELLDLDMPGLLSAVAALLAFVPNVGILAGALPLALIALINGPTESIAVLVGAVGLQTVDAFVVQRRIDRATAPVGVFLTLVAAMIGFSLHGPGGMLVAVAVITLVVAVVNDAGAVQTLRRTLPADDDAAAAPAADPPPAPA